VLHAFSLSGLVGLCTDYYFILLYYFIILNHQNHHHIIHENHHIIFIQVWKLTACLLTAAHRSSAVLGMDEDRICALQEDHFSTARPADRNSDAYIHLREHIKRCLSKLLQGMRGLAGDAQRGVELPLHDAAPM